jgi:hypothetical protein
MEMHALVLEMRIEQAKLKGTDDEIGIISLTRSSWILGFGTKTMRIITKEIEKTDPLGTHLRKEMIDITKRTNAMSIVA